jgi:hypothetical protein
VFPAELREMSGIAESGRIDELAFDFVGASECGR